MKTYTSKLEIGQRVWVMKENKAVSRLIESIKISVTDNSSPSYQKIDISILYCFRLKNDRDQFIEWENFYEKDVFATKEELLASL